jgi:hypothetical protein
MVSPPQLFYINRSSAICIFRKKNKGIKNWVKAMFMKDSELEDSINTQYVVYFIE